VLFRGAGFGTGLRFNDSGFLLRGCGVPAFGNALFGWVAVDGFLLRVLIGVRTLGIGLPLLRVKDGGTRPLGLGLPADAFVLAIFAALVVGAGCLGLPAFRLREVVEITAG